MGIPSAVRNTYTAKASDLIVDGNWAIPDSIKTIMKGAGVVIQAIPKPSGDALKWRSLFWMHTLGLESQSGLCCHFPEVPIMQPCP